MSERTAEVKMSDDDWQVLLAAVENMRGGSSDPDARWRIAYALEQVAKRVGAALKTGTGN
jgi:hypothetical protein